MFTKRIFMGLLFGLTMLAWGGLVHGEDANTTRMRISERILGRGARSARAAAMGGAYTGLANTPDTLFHNPAGLSRNEKCNVRALYQHDEVEGDNAGGGSVRMSESQPGAVLVVPVGGAAQVGTMGVGFVYTDVDVPRWSTEVSRNEFTVGWGMPLCDTMHWGVAYSYSSQNTDANEGFNRETDMHLVKGGLLWDVCEFLSVGADGHIGMGDWDNHLRTPPTDEGDRINAGIGAGVAWNICPSLTTTLDGRYDYYSADSDHRVDEEDLGIASLHVGIEKRCSLCFCLPEYLNPQLALRAGYRVSHADWDVQKSAYDGAADTINAGTMGLGLAIGCVSADYAAEWREYGEWSHVVSMGTAF